MPLLGGPIRKCYVRSVLMHAFARLSCATIISIDMPFLMFKVVSGLKINLSKSEMVPVGDVEGLTSIIGCRVASMPMKYLGLFWELLRAFPAISSSRSLYLRIQTTFYFPISKCTPTASLNRSLYH